MFLIVNHSSNFQKYGNSGTQGKSCYYFIITYVNFVTFIFFGFVGNGGPSSTAPLTPAVGVGVGGGQDEGRSGFARRALDRGLRASNQFLYRSIFNLLPAFIETLCVISMIIQRAGMMVGLTAAIVAYSFVGLTMLVMKKRIPILRRQLRDEG